MTTVQTQPSTDITSKRLAAADHQKLDALEQCPVCKSDQYLNPNLKLLVSPCFHKMCESCINRIFLSGPAPCPICKSTLRKSNFVAQTFEDLYVEKEIQIRKKIGKIFNKRIEDFDNDLRAYNDYLEEVEVLLFNLINDVDVQETQEKIEKYKIENKELIAANLSKQMTEEKVLLQRLEREKKEKQLRKEAYLNQFVESEKAKKQEHEKLINQLANAKEGENAVDIVAEAIQKKGPVRAFEFVQDVEIHLNDAHDESSIHDSTLIDYDPIDHLYLEPTYTIVAPSYNDPWTKSLKSEESSTLTRASGFIPMYTYSRAISSAFSGLFHTEPKS